MTFFFTILLKKYFEILITLETSISIYKIVCPIEIFKNFIDKNKNSFEGIFISEMKFYSKNKLLQRNFIFFDRIKKKNSCPCKVYFHEP